MTEDIESLSFNTAISQMMIFVNAFTRTHEAIPISAMRTFLDFAESVRAASQLRALGEVEIARRHHGADWPSYDAKLLVEDEVEIVLQMNGKVRDRMTMSISATEDEMKAAALANPKIKELIAGKRFARSWSFPKSL